MVLDVSHTSLAAAQTDANNRDDSLIRHLRGSGLRHDVRTLNFAIYPVQRGDGLQPASAPRFNVLHFLEVRTRDVAGLGALLDSALASGATRVDRVHFEADDIESLRVVINVEELSSEPIPLGQPSAQPSLAPGQSSTEARLRVTWAGA